MVVGCIAWRTIEASSRASGDKTLLDIAPVTGPVTLPQIMTEKYIVRFQNAEAWNDYKRTCLPALVPANGAVALPGRLLYAIAERQTNIPCATGAIRRRAPVAEAASP